MQSSWIQIDIKHLQREYLYANCLQNLGLTMFFQFTVMHMRNCTCYAWCAVEHSTGLFSLSHKMRIFHNYTTRNRYSYSKRAAIAGSILFDKYAHKNTRTRKLKLKFNKLALTPLRFSLAKHYLYYIRVVCLSIVVSF